MVSGNGDAWVGLADLMSSIERYIADNALELVIPDQLTRAERAGMQLKPSDKPGPRNAVEVVAYNLQIAARGMAATDCMIDDEFPDAELLHTMQQQQNEAERRIADILPGLGSDLLDLVAFAEEQGIQLLKDCDEIEL